MKEYSPNQQRWIEVVNGSGEEIPPFAAMFADEIDVLGVPTVIQPTSAGVTPLLFNGAVAIPVGGRGLATMDLPTYALYETGDGAPEGRQSWGSYAGSWKLRKDRPGYAIWGGADETPGAPDGRVLIVEQGSGANSLSVDYWEGEAPSEFEFTNVRFITVENTEDYPAPVFLYEETAGTVTGVVLRFYPASSTQVGIVSLEDQTLGAGAKRFNSRTVHRDAVRFRPPADSTLITGLAEGSEDEPEDVADKFGNWFEIQWAAVSAFPNTQKELEFWVQDSFYDNLRTRIARFETYSPASFGGRQTRLHIDPNAACELGSAGFRVSGYWGVTGAWTNPTFISVVGGMVTSVHGTPWPPEDGSDGSDGGGDGDISSTSLGTGSASGGSLTLTSISVEAGAVLTVAVALFNEGEIDSVTTVTFDGVSLNQVAFASTSGSGGGNYGKIMIWRLPIATPTTADVAISNTGAIDHTMATAIQIENLPSLGASLDVGQASGSGTQPAVALSEAVAGAGSYVASAFVLVRDSGSVGALTWGGHTGGQEATATLGSAGLVIGEGYKIPTTVGTHEATLTLGVAPDVWAGAIVALV